MSYLYRTGNGRNNIAFTTTANSSTKYLRRTASSRTSIVWTTIPSGSTYNILNRTGTGRNNIAWSNLYIPIPGVALSTKSPGDIVKIKENGTFVDFLVLIHNYPASGRTLLIRKDCYAVGKWGSYSYNGSTVDNYLNSTYLNVIDTQVRNNISSVTINCHDGNISRKVFLLSAIEYAKASEWLEGTTTLRMYVEGESIPYFADSRSNRDTNLASGTTEYQMYLFTRTPYYMSAGTYVWAPRPNGYVHGYVSADHNYNYRPAFTLPSSILVNTSNQIAG